MSPNEAAELLGVTPSATHDEVQSAYDARLAEAGADEERRDAVTAARDALLAASAWQAPPVAAPGPQTYPPSGPAATVPYPGYPHAGYPGTPMAQGQWNAPAPSRRRLSTGAIIGITLGSMAAGLVVLLIAVTAILSIAHSTSRLAESQAGSSAAPFDDPSSGPSDDPSGIPSAEPTEGAGSDGSAADDYDIDGARVHYVDGWTFELTPTLSCAGATITASFSDSPDGETMDVWSTTADLQAGVPYELTIPDDASEFDYVGIDSIDCSQA